MPSYSATLLSEALRFLLGGAASESLPLLRDSVYASISASRFSSAVTVPDGCAWCADVAAGAWYPMASRYDSLMHSVPSWKKRSRKVRYLLSFVPLMLRRAVLFMVYFKDSRVWFTGVLELAGVYCRSCVDSKSVRRASCFSGVSNVPTWLSLWRATARNAWLTRAFSTIVVGGGQSRSCLRG